MTDESKPKVEPDEKRGLYDKYEVIRLNDPKRKHGSCFFYVLDMAHDKFGIPALWAYAEAAESEFPALAHDLREIVKAKCDALQIPLPAFARSRPAVAAGDEALGFCSHGRATDAECAHCNAEQYRDEHPAPPSSDPAPAPTKIHLSPTCEVCGRQKKPWGRSAPLGMNLCDYECKGYEMEPHVGSLWPNEDEPAPRETAGAVAPVEGTLLMLGQVARERDSLRTRFDAIAFWPMVVVLIILFFLFTIEIKP